MSTLAMSSLLTSPFNSPDGKNKLCVETKVIVEWYSRYYLAKIVSTPVEKDGQYLLHFIGWNQRFDAWFGVENLFEYNETNLEKMKLANQVYPKTPPRGLKVKPVTENRRQSSIGKNSLRKNLYTKR